MRIEINCVHHSQLVSIEQNGKEDEDDCWCMKLVNIFGSELSGEGTDEKA